MPTYQAGTEVAIEQYGVLKKELEKITSDRRIIAQQMAIAMRYAIKPTFAAFEQYVNAIPVVTGNLRAAVSQKVKKYNLTGNVVGLVGFYRERRGKRSPDQKGRDRAYHQHLVEYGTQYRKTSSGANRGASPRGGTKGIQPLTLAYKQTIGIVNSRLVQKTPKVLEATYRKLEKIKAKGR
jgi:hypothetical protein